MCRSIKSFDEFLVMAWLRLGTETECVGGLAKGLGPSTDGRTMAAREDTAVRSSPSGLLELCGNCSVATFAATERADNVASRRSRRSDSRRPLDDSTR